MGVLRLSLYTYTMAEPGFRQGQGRLTMLKSEGLQSRCIGSLLDSRAAGGKENCPVRTMERLLVTLPPPHT